MFLNIDQLEKQLDNEEFQKIGSMVAFKVLETQFQMFIKSQIYLDDDYVVMTRNYFLQYTQLEIPEFSDTLIHHMESVKKSINERAQHKREYDSRVNDRQMQIIEEKVDTSKVLDASLVDIESSGTESKEQNTSSRSGNDAHADDADIRPIYNEEPMAETTRAKTIEHTTSLIAQNAEFKAQLQEKGFAIPALKNELRKLIGNSVNTKFAKSSILEKPVLQPHRNQSFVRQPTAFKSERPRISKSRFASQVDVNNDLPKPVTTHYLPRERESAFAKPHHMIAPSSSRYSSNDMVHNHYLEEAKKKTQESSRTSEPSVMPSARSQSTANGSKPKPRINNQNSRNWHASKSSCVMTKTVPIAEHSRNSRNFSDSKHFVCSTCQKCVFNANHDSCVTKFLNEVNSRAKNSVFHDHTMKRSSSKLVKVVPTADRPSTSQQELYGGGGIPFQLKSNSLPHAHAQTTKTYYKHQDSRIKKAQKLKTKTSANSNIKDNFLETKLQGRLLESFQDDAKKPHFEEDCWPQDNESNMKAWNLSETKLRGRLLASNYIINLGLYLIHKTVPRISLHCTFELPYVRIWVVCWNISGELHFNSQLVVTCVVPRYSGTWIVECIVVVPPDTFIVAYVRMVHHGKHAVKVVACGGTSVLYFFGGNLEDECAMYGVVKLSI
ncbi:hypothetical protein Tco_0327892 [Tanacetum coccineum]